MQGVEADVDPVQAGVGQGAAVRSSPMAFVVTDI